MKPKSYRETFGHIEDFRVKYRLFTQEEGGRKYPPSQRIHWDFWYEHSDHHALNRIFMIYPEFENGYGEVLDENAAVSRIGTARMWISLNRARSYHQTRIKIGTRCYFMEGAKKVGECEVIEIVGLLSNPIVKG